MLSEVEKYFELCGLDLLAHFATSLLGQPLFVYHVLW